LDSMGASKRDVAYCWRKFKSKPWPDMSPKKKKKNPKTNSRYKPHSSPVNLFITENTYIAFSCVWVFKGTLNVKCFNADVQVQLDNCVWMSGLNGALTARMCIIPSCCETGTIIGSVILL
jgi:hypothetical protein